VGIVTRSKFNFFFCFVSEESSYGEVEDCNYIFYRVLRLDLRGAHLSSCPEHGKCTFDPKYIGSLYPETNFKILKNLEKFFHPYISKFCVITYSFIVK
jgi:hypothetical protein